MSVSLKPAELLAKALALPHDPHRHWLEQPGFGIDHDSVANCVATPGGWVSPRDAQVDVQMHPICRDNLVAIAPIEMPRLSITIRGKRNTILIGASPKLAGRITIVGDDNLLFIGAGCKCNNGHFVLRSQGCSILVGEQSMLSFDTSIYNSDMHGIVDLQSLDQINPPQSVVLQPRVWLGDRAMILKGSQVGPGTVIGANSVVTGEIPACCVATGTPARVIRQGVSWTHEAHPSPAARQALRARLSHVWPASHDTSITDPHSPS